MPETEWKIEDKSIGSGTDINGSEEPPPGENEWDFKEGEDSQKNVDTVETLPDDGPKCVGEMHVLLFEDETMLVTFPNLGRWTLGRLQKAMNPIFRVCQIERAKELRRAEGLPEEFVMSDRDQE